MIKSTTTTKSALTPKLRRRLVEHKAEVERLRQEIGDVPAALSVLVREAFDAASFAPTSTERTKREKRNGQSVDDDDDLSGW